MSLTQKRGKKDYSVFAELAELQSLALGGGQGSRRPLPESEIVTRSLSLTMTNPTARQKQLAFEFWKHFGSHGQSQTDIEEQLDKPSLIPTKEQMCLSKAELNGRFQRAHSRGAHRWWDHIAIERSWFRSAIESLISNPKRARASLNPFIYEFMSDVVVVPNLSWDGRRSATNLYYHCSSTHGLIAYALMLILDTGKGFGKALRICKYQSDESSCDNIFLGEPSKKGSPRPKYCGPDCRTAARKMLAADRTSRWRANLTKKRGKK